MSGHLSALRRAHAMALLLVASGVSQVPETRSGAAESRPGGVLISTEPTIVIREPGFQSDETAPGVIRGVEPAPLPEPHDGVPDALNPRLRTTVDNAELARKANEAFNRVNVEDEERTPRVLFAVFVASGILFAGVLLMLTRRRRM